MAFRDLHTIAELFDDLSGRHRVESATFEVYHLKRATDRERLRDWRNANKAHCNHQQRAAYQTNAQQREARKAASRDRSRAVVQRLSADKGLRAERNAYQREWRRKRAAQKS